METKTEKSRKKRENKEIVVNGKETGKKKENVENEKKREN